MSPTLFVVLVLVLLLAFVLSLAFYPVPRTVPPSRIVYSHARETARHRRQIARGLLRYHHTDIPAIRQS